MNHVENFIFIDFKFFFTLYHNNLTFTLLYCTIIITTSVNQKAEKRSSIRKGRGGRGSSMVLVLLPVLIGAAVVGIASGGQYGDYAAAKMPQYASDEYHDAGREAASSGDDYQDRSPEVPASPDYKYEENVNLRTVNTRNDEDWRKSTKKMPRGLRSDFNSPIKHSNLHSLNFKNNQKSKQTIRPRSKSRKTGRKYELNRNPLRSGRIRSNDIIDKEVDYISEDRYRDRFENDKTSVTSERIVRRKPRDRAVNRPEVEIEDLDDDEEDEIKNEQEETKNLEYPASVDSILQERLGEQFEGKEENFHIQRPTPLQIEDDILGRLDSKKEDQKAADEYQDYYDMKRVKNIKKKITVLYRRTKARATGSTTSRRVRVWTYRSSYIDRYATPINDEVLFRATRIRTTKRRKPTARTLKKTVESNKLTRTTKPAKSTKITKSTTRTQHTEATMHTNATIKHSEQLAYNVSELSLAEKSRLSILKKAQLKDGEVGKSITAKPPVLMQVTQKMQTMVMLEPQNKGGNLELKGKFGNLVSEDTPERLARAKRIMRRRLVSGARNIHDLTDNWDEMVCDYLDMAELDGDESSPTVKSAQVAERELRAVLGAHRQRKEVTVISGLVDSELMVTNAPTLSPSIPTFPPKVVDSRLTNEWNDFVLRNNSTRLHFSINIVFLVIIINLLQRYNIHLLV